MADLRGLLGFEGLVRFVRAPRLLLDLGWRQRRHGGEAVSKRTAQRSTKARLALKNWACIDPHSRCGGLWITARSKLSAARSRTLSQWLFPNGSFSTVLSLTARSRPSTRSRASVMAACLRPNADCASQTCDSMYASLHSTFRGPRPRPWHTSRGTQVGARSRKPTRPRSDKARALFSITHERKKKHAHARAHVHTVRL